MKIFQPTLIHKTREIPSYRALADIGILFMFKLFPMFVPAALSRESLIALHDKIGNPWAFATCLKPKGVAADEAPRNAYELFVTFSIHLHPIKSYIKEAQ
jgi:hypothetical protein